MENLFIKNFILQGILEDLKKETKKTISKCRTQKNLKGKKEKATSEELQKYSEKLVKTLAKQKIKYLSYANRKAIETGNINEISKIENNNNTIMLYLKLMEKEKIEDKQASNTKYNQIYIKSKKTLENYMKKLFSVSDYMYRKDKKSYLHLFFDTLKYKTIEGKGQKKQVLNAYYKSLKPLYKHLTKAKKGYIIDYKEDFKELQSQVIIELLEKNHDKIILLNSKSIFYRILNKISYIYQKNNIVNCNTFSLDRQLENSNTTYYNYLENSNTIDIFEKDFTSSLIYENMNAKEKSIYLLKLKGLTFAEISKKLSYSLSDVKMTFYRIKARI